MGYWVMNNDEKARKSVICGHFFSTKYKIRTYDPIRVKDVLYH